MAAFSYEIKETVVGPPEPKHLSLMIEDGRLDVEIHLVEVELEQLLSLLLRAKEELKQLP